MRSLRDVITKPEIERGAIVVYLSDGDAADHHSVVHCDTVREAIIQMWASAAEKEYAYLYGWSSNVHMFNHVPPDHLRNEVLALRSELNFCPDCMHHKPNLEGFCGVCGAGV